MGLSRHLQEKGGGIQNPGTRKWAACTGPRREERSTRKIIVPNRGPDLPESSSYTWRSHPSCWNSWPRKEGRQLYSLPMNHRERDSLPKDPFVSTLTVALSQAREQMAGHPKDDLLSVQFSSVSQSCTTLCTPQNCSIPGLSVQHHLPEYTQTHVHRGGDAIQP